MEKLAYNCEKCQYSTGDKYYFRTHEKSKKHRGIPPKATKNRPKENRYCDACDKSFVDPTRYKAHLITYKHKSVVGENLNKKIKELEETIRVLRKSLKMHSDNADFLQRLIDDNEDSESEEEEDEDKSD